MLDEGLNLIKRQENTLNDSEQKIRLFVELLLKGEITIDKYIEFRNLVGSVETKLTAAESRKVEQIIPARKAAIQKDNNLKFCINCGAKLSPGNRFCMHCGAKL